MIIRYMFTMALQKTAITATVTLKTVAGYRDVTATYPLFSLRQIVSLHRTSDLTDTDHRQCLDTE